MKLNNYDFELQVEEFTINSSEITSLIGPSGSGKSIFLRTLAGQINQDFSNYDFNLMKVSHKP